MGGGTSVLLTGGEDSTAGIVAALKSLADATLEVPVTVRIGSPFKDVERSVLVADLGKELGVVAQFQSVHGMNLSSHQSEVAADFALAGILVRVRMQRSWLERMLEKGALGVPGYFDSSKGGELRVPCRSWQLRAGPNTCQRAATPSGTP